MNVPLAIDPLLTVPEVAERFRVSRATIYRWNSEGRPLPKMIKLGGDDGNIRFFQSEVEKFLQEQNGKGNL